MRGSRAVGVQDFVPGASKTKGFFWPWDIIALSRNAHRWLERRRTWSSTASRAMWPWRTSGTWSWSEWNRTQSIPKFAVSTLLRRTITSPLWVRRKVLGFPRFYFSFTFNFMFFHGFVTHSLSLCFVLVIMFLIRFYYLSLPVRFWRANTRNRGIVGFWCSYWYVRAV